MRIEMNTQKVQVANWKDFIAKTRNEITSIQNKATIETNEKLDILEAEQLRIEKELADHMSTCEVYNTAAAMLKDGGIKSRIIKQYIPIINKLINKYLSALDFFVQFELNESFEETIKSRYRDTFSYESFSEGEKMRLNLAILFTWRAVAKLRNSINTNLLVLDEVFDSSLDINGTDEFMKMLNGLTKDTNTFIISHKSDALIDKFESILKFQKVKNFSKLAI